MGTYKNKTTKEIVEAVFFSYFDRDHHNHHRIYDLIDEAGKVVSGINQAGEIIVQTAKKYIILEDSDWCIKTSTGEPYKYTHSEFAATFTWIKD